MLSHTALLLLLNFFKRILLKWNKYQEYFNIFIKFK